jgi:hypothetical protein
MFQGISMIVKVKESVKKENLKELILDDAVLMIERAEEYEIAGVIIADKSSKYLRNALTVFLRENIQKFNL